MMRPIEWYVGMPLGNCLYCLSQSNCYSPNICIAFQPLAPHKIAAIVKIQHLLNHILYLHLLDDLQSFEFRLKRTLLATLMKNDYSNRSSIFKKVQFI